MPETLRKPVEVEYFAVPDPDDAERMTYWRMSSRGLVSWPPAARYGPRLLKRDVPRDLRGAAKAEWVHAWFQNTRFTWQASVIAAINADQHAAAARFAVFAIRCYCCGRALTDPQSKTLGIGPECRSGMPVEILAALNEQVGRLHASLNTAPETFDIFAA
jgi:hypothetical protein